ncbi:MAG: SsrA-binding protein SmpB [Bdellovibrionota bacterium]
MAAKDDGKKTISTNKDAHFRYFISDTYEAGIALLGTEVKALRNAKVQMSDAYVFIKNGEAYLSNMHIGEYSHGNRENHAPMRVRKLLLNKSELNKIEQALNEKGLTIVPTQMYFVKGKAKVEIGVGKGKKTHDKRQTIKEQESKRELARIRKR